MKRNTLLIISILLCIFLYSNNAYSLGALHLKICTLDSDCDDGRYCTGVETCGIDGFCDYGTNPCTSSFPGQVGPCSPTSSGCSEIADTCGWTCIYTDPSCCTSTTSCTLLEVCGGTGCYQNSECGDGNSCTDDACYGNECFSYCNATTYTSPCCSNPACDNDPNCYPECTVNGDCDDSNACTTNTCVSGGCVYTCNATAPGDACCSNGACAGYPACVAAPECEEASDCPYVNKCTTGVYSCVGGSCILGPPLNCNDGNACSTDTCSSNRCYNTCASTVSYGDPCCSNPVCVSDFDCQFKPCVTNGDCNDGLYCNGVETCGISGYCVNGSAPSCNDSNSCTTDSCSNALGACVNTCNATGPTSSCCSNPACAGDEDCYECTVDEDCDDGEDCTTDTCNVGAHECVYTPDDSECDDGIGCTVDTCTPFTGCTNEEDDSICGVYSEGHWCLGAFVCDENVTTPVAFIDAVLDSATGGPVWTLEYPDGTDDDAFTTLLQLEVGTKGYMNILTINRGTEVITATKVLGFVGNPAAGDTIRQYAPIGCKYLADPCPQDSYFCNGHTFCSEETQECVSFPVNCDDGVPCTVDTCSESLDRCVHTPNNSLCPDDGYYCNGVGTCTLFGCISGTPVNCDDGIACTADSCDEDQNKCIHETYDSACSDGLWCNGAETCNRYTGCHDGSQPCNDSNICTDDDCNEETRTCTNTCNATTPLEACCGNSACRNEDICQLCEDDADCTDGIFCNGEETCNLVTNLCEDGTPISCSDSDPCTNDLCWETTHTCVYPCKAATPNDQCCGTAACLE